MATISTYKQKDGTTSHRVRWYQGGRQVGETFPTAKAAETWRRIIEAAGGDTAKAVRALEHKAATGPTVAENLTDHIDQLTGVGDYQIHRYRRAVPRHFDGELGKIPVAVLTHRDVVAWIREMQGRGLSAKTIANYHGLLSASMKTAMREGRRPDNPCEKVRLPRDQSTADVMRIIDREQMAALLEAMPTGYAGLARFLLESGLRFGEAAALDRADFTLSGVPSVRVTKAWKSVDSSRFVVGPPKTRKARRTVSLGAGTVAALTLPESGLVFTTERGTPVRSSGFHKAWRIGWDRLGVSAEDRPRPHDLRHTHASRMLEAGLNMYELSRRLGHESIQTSIDRYSHLEQGAHLRAATAADRAFG